VKRKPEDTVNYARAVTGSLATLDPEKIEEMNVVMNQNSRLFNRVMNVNNKIELL
jgi:hypothetical protein